LHCNRFVVSHTNNESTLPVADEWLAERTRIAQDLHDTLLQGFFAVSLRLQAAVDQLPDNSEVRPQFHEVVELMSRVLEQGRLTVQGLRSPEGYSSPLGQALAGIPTQLGLPQVARFRVVVDGQPRELRSDLREDVYRISREAIINAYLHSNAKDIETQIEYRPSELRIAVRDNGCGIDPKDLALVRNRRWGLQGMRERADRIGARLRVLSRIALGTEVELCVPGRVAFEHS
jgi:signal transduction histidine kinase